ncbi:MAG: hypothetical protein LW807_07260 [Proteobacteria bacterium]|jgi:hypothetical protein|nr:hypothetical protein [Pseudomonadota bacterium]
MDNNKLIKQFVANLDKKGLDSSLLENDIFDFNQKFVLYNAIRSGANLEVLANPDIDAYEMEDILDEQRDMMKEMRNNHGINPEKYNLSQLLELNDAIVHNLDISQYKNHEYTANHMYIAKTFQIEKLEGIDNITPDMSISELIKLRDDARELKTFINLENDEQNINEQSHHLQNNTSSIVMNMPPNFDNNEEVIKFFNEINPYLVEQVINKNEICFAMKGMIISGEHAQENPKLLFELFASNCGFKVTDINSKNVISSEKQLQCREM